MKSLMTTENSALYLISFNIDDRQLFLIYHLTSLLFNMRDYFFISILARNQNILFIERFRKHPTNLFY